MITIRGRRRTTLTGLNQTLYSRMAEESQMLKKQTKQKQQRWPDVFPMSKRRNGRL